VPPGEDWSGGYSLGYELVRRYLATRGMTASEAATLSAEEVLTPLLLAGLARRWQRTKASSA
jgi:uncharacterized protein YjaZ